MGESEVGSFAGVAHDDAATTTKAAVKNKVRKKLEGIEGLRFLARAGGEGLPGISRERSQLDSCADAKANRF